MHLFKQLTVESLWMRFWRRVTTCIHYCMKSHVCIDACYGSLFIFIIHQNEVLIKKKTSGFLQNLKHVQPVDFKMIKDILKSNKECLRKFSKKQYSLSWTFWACLEVNWRTDVGDVHGWTLNQDSQGSRVCSALSRTQEIQGYSNFVVEYLIRTRPI